MNSSNKNTISKSTIYPMHPSDRFFTRFYLPRLINLHFQTYFAKKALIWFSIRLETKTLES